MSEIFTGRRANRASVMAAVKKGVSRSLFPLLFSAVPPGGEPTELDFHPDKMASNASACCKLAGLLIQACWCRLMEKKSRAIPPSINDMLRQIWSGNQSYTEGAALSLLNYAGVAPPDSPFREWVDDSKIFVEWRDLLVNAKQRRFKDYCYSFRDFDKFLKFIELIKALPILRSVEYEADKRRFRLPLGATDAFPYILQFPALEQPLFLFRFLNSDKDPIIVYEDPFSNHTEQIRLQDAPDQLSSYDLLRQVIGLQGVQVPRGDIFFFGTGYENLRNLAGIIANKVVTPEGVLEAALGECRNETRDRDSFSRIVERSKEEDILNCITLVFVEFGPAHLLRKLFVKHTRLFEDYLKELSRLHETRIKPDKLRKQCEAERLRKQACIDRYLDLDSEIKSDIENTFRVDTQCWGILRAIGVDSVDSDWGGQYVESLPIRIRMLEKCRKDVDNVRSRGGDEHALLSDTVLKVNKLTERTFRFLICFYAGLFEYYNSREKGRGTYETHEACMINAAKAKYREIQKSAGKLIEEFRSICEEARKSSVIDALLGRRSVCNFKGRRGKAIDGMLGTINQIKHDKNKSLTREGVEKFLDQTLEIFCYLKDGEDQEGPVYPHVVSFCEARHKRGGFVIHNYNMVSHDKGGGEAQQINILTPREFSASEQYYCIPVEDRATQQYWLEPFLIGCNQFDTIFEEDSVYVKKRN
jgi:hypothetical protein